MENLKSKERGVTLVSLVITIIVLILLAGVGLNALFGDSGIIKNAEKAKQETEISNEKELISQANTLALAQSRTGEITVEEMQKAMNETAGEKATTAINNGDKIAVKFEKSGRYYNLDENGNIEKFTPYFDTTPGILIPNLDEEYMIESIEDLVVYSAIINGIYTGTDIKKEDIPKIKSKAVLMCDLDFKSPLSYGDSTTTIYNGYLGVEEENVPLIEALTNTEKYKGFIPIGCASSGFGGSFDGKNHAIKNLFENIETSAGLFGLIMDRGTVQNITVTGEIKSTTYAGGVVGQITDQSGGHHIINCTNYASIYSDTYSGGVIGDRWGCNGTIKLCTNYGNVKAKSSAGGIVGYLTGNGAAKDEMLFSENCNYGYVYGEKYAGGLVGTVKSMNGILLNCLNGENAVIESNASSGSAGGILGGPNFRIYNCINLGGIKAYRAGRNYRNTRKLDIYNKKLL